MKKLGWYAGSAALVLMVGGGLLLLAANLYVQSKGVQQQIRRALASTLKMPAELTKTTVTPWEGLRIDGITVRPESPGQISPDVIKADSFRVRFALGALLLQRRFVVREVLLDRPNLAWAQDGQGRWRFPPEELAPPPPGTLVEPPVPSPAPRVSLPPGTSAPAPVVVAPPDRVEKRPARFSVDVDKFRLRHGALEFLDRDAQPIGRFENVNVDGHMHGPRSASGALWFDKAHLAHSGVTLTKFESRFSYDEVAGFSLESGKAEIGGGQLWVQYDVRTREDGSPFNVDCHFDEVEIDKLFTLAAGVLHGRLQGVIKVKGLTGDPASLRGEGKFTLLEGKLKDFAMLKAVGASLRIEDLGRLELKTAQLDCHLEGEQVLVDSLNIVSNNVRLTARGRYDLKADRLDVQARLIIDQAIGRQLPQFIETNFAPCGDEAAPGSRYVEFNVSGPIAKPSTNLLERVLTGPLGSLFENMLAPKPKNPNKKPKKTPPAPPPDATPAA